MGILTMLGLMKVEDHKAAITSANLEMAKLGNWVSEEKGKRLKADDEAARWKRAYDKAHDQATDNGLKFNKAVKDLAAQSDEIAALKMSADLDNDTIRGLRAQLEAAEQVILELKPDAEKFRAKAARDAEQKRAKRAAAKAG